MCKETETRDLHWFEERYSRNAAKRIEKRLGLRIAKAHAFDEMPIICNDRLEEIMMGNWSLIPTYSPTRKLKYSTYNARYEEVFFKKTFKPYLDNRCLIPITAFFEWQHRDKTGRPNPDGKYTQKYRITAPKQEVFSVAGLWSPWVDPETKEELRTFTMLTTAATGIMEEIHNSTLRMPLTIEQQYEEQWLRGEEVDACTLEFEAEELKPPKKEEPQGVLF